jgi:hypothetical protein
LRDVQLELNGGGDGTEKEGEKQVVEKWKTDIINKAIAMGLITKEANHQPDDTAPKWFVLAIVMNGIDYVLNKIGGK